MQAANNQFSNNQAVDEYQSKEEADTEKFNLGDDNTDWEALIKNKYFNGYKALTLYLDGKEINLYGYPRGNGRGWIRLGIEVCKYYASDSQYFNYVTSNIKYFNNEYDLKNDPVVKYDNISNRYYRDVKGRRYYERYSTDVYVHFSRTASNIVKLIKQLYDGMKGCVIGKSMIR